MGVEREEPQAASRFRVMVLGRFAVERDGVSLEAGGWQHRVQALLKLLATAPNRQVLRDDLIEVLWPEADVEHGTANLRTLVHRLRLALGHTDPSPVLSAAGWVALNPAYGWELDLDEFEARVADAVDAIDKLEVAASLYRGEPLVEDRYEDWARPTRERAERAWHELCLRLGSLHDARGSCEGAVVWYERALQADPVDEEALRGELLALSRSGRPADALRRYQQFELRLGEEIDAPPSAESAALAAEIRAQLESQTRAPAADREQPLPVGKFLGARPEGPLIDRGEELDRALLAVEAVEAGSGRLVVVSGEAGVGKTRLAQEIGMELRRRTFLVVTGSCHERHRAVPYYPFLTLLPQAYAAAPESVRLDARRRWPELEWLLPDQIVGAPDDSTEDGDDRYPLFRAVTGLLGAISEVRPLALLLDDLHWADEGTVDLLHHFVHQTRGSRIFILVTYRDRDISREHPLAVVLRALGREGLVERIALGRFDLATTSSFIAALMGTPAGTDEFTEFVFRRTRGNPFFIHRIVQTLGGRYQLAQQIGAGGMGRVFEAIDTKDGRHVAVKIMFARAEADAKAVLRFQQEAAVLSELRHPNIVQVYGTLIEEYASCIVMERIEGRTLGQRMREGRLPLPEIKRIAGQIAAALASAHERGIVHRDIKPDNVMLGDDGRVVVTDFGIARLTRPSDASTTLTSTGMTLGTPLYMPPEQIEGRRVDGRADIYSLGALLYELVTGRPPFEGSDPLSIALKHVNEPPTPPRFVNEDVTEDWEALILRALAKDPGDRFQSAVAMAGAIGLLSTEEATPRTGRARLLPTGVPPMGHDPQPRKRRTRLAQAVLSGVAVLSIAGAAGFWLAGQAGNPPGATSYLGTGPGQFDGPTGLVLDRQGNLFAVDQGNNRLQELSAGGRPLAQWGTRGSGSLQFNAPSDVDISPDGRIYVVDHANSRIPVLRNGKQIDEIEAYASGVAVDSRGMIYAPDSFHHWMNIYAPNDSTRPAVSWPISEIHAGRRPYPAGLAVDEQGDVYMADRSDNRVIELSPRGEPLFTFGMAGHGPAQFDDPTDVALGAGGTIYVADAKNDRVCRFSATGRLLRTWGSPGSELGQFSRPSSVAVDPRGNIYVSDYYNNRVQKFSASGKVLWATHGSQPLVPSS